MSVARSASGDGVSPSASSLARTNRSIGLRTQSARRTAGSAGRRGRDEGPVRGVCGPLGDPAFQDRLLLGRQPPIRLRRRHQLAGILRVDPLDQLARLGIVRDDRAGLDRRVSDVESQLGLSLVGVLPVAIEAVLREDRPDVAIEVQGGRRGPRFAGRYQEREASRQEESEQRARKSLDPRFATRPPIHASFHDRTPLANMDSVSLRIVIADRPTRAGRFATPPGARLEHLKSGPTRSRQWGEPNTRNV